ERVVERRQLFLAATIESRHEQLVRMRAVAADVRHGLPTRRRAEAGQVSVPGRDLRARAAGGGHAHQMIVAAEAGAEVHEAAVGAEGGRTRDQKPSPRYVPPGPTLWRR